MQTIVGILNPHPNIGYLKIYRCQTYALKWYILCIKKLEPYTYIEYLVGYDSINIFQIWISSKQKVISICDVTFNETQFYDLKIPDTIQLNQLSE